MIKRVLWVDDMPQNKASRFFPERETHIIRSMDEAIKEFASERLYDYDLIVLDIDFSNDIIREEEIINKLTRNIYLSKDQRKKRFLIENGGYLLFLYLLEQGYPSNQIIFLTGNGGIIEQLKRYKKETEREMSKSDILQAFLDAWSAANNDIDSFQDMILELPINKKYKDADFVFDCAAWIVENNTAELTKAINSIVPEMVTGAITNTGDEMIFRFHEANLEPPRFFSKNENDIIGCNLEDVGKLLRLHRTTSRVSRWLVLSFGDYLERLFLRDSQAMTNSINNIFRNVSEDGGIRDASRQMFFVFDGLRSTQDFGGLLYQAVSSIMVPFDAKLYNTPSHQFSYSDRDIRRIIAYAAKQARNYCAHNLFGSTISIETALYLLLIVACSLLNRDMRQNLLPWYESSFSAIKTTIPSQRSSNIYTIDQLFDHYNNLGQIDWHKVNPNGSTPPESLNEEGKLYALGYNQEMSRNRESDSIRRESYYRFLLATYIYTIFHQYTEDELQRLFGRELVLLYKLSEMLARDFDPN